MNFFLETDTGDITGKTTKSEKEQTFSEKQIQEIVNSFDNYTYWQHPPLYSAIKIRGKKLYEYARKGLKVEVPPRQVLIKTISLVNYDKAKNSVNLVVECSK